MTDDAEAGRASAEQASRGRSAGPRLMTDERGMSTAEYAVGTVAACGFAGILYKVLTNDSVLNLLGSIIKHALDTLL
jgi:hypothetical protein